MTKKLFFFVVSACLLFLIISGLHGVYSVEGPAKEQKAVESKPAVPAPKTDNKIAIAHTEIFGELERPQVIFDHQKHVEALKKEEGKKEAETCRTCHPVDKEMDLILFSFPKKVKGKDKDSVMHAYHDECITCHKEKRIEKKKAGPVVCAECHLENLRSA
jgi:cytochrome c2